ncbi:TetR/AcrR family transcriptional regulator [Nocardia cyriacigeorgica]|uniref:TetR/AcrR family transcriptional regulator n=1 Tax=Nocardia cyriacigeorgica TaxID=135487 RepID=A0A6P1DCN0_9NOCA|nr:TetR/AcrR family transcriptional regulator [Nocardia cyriacigeorgica]NEW41106.1 TetR/AcrR family transcriptional regulator [Nocardia cyriacigeorgica]NEW48247.1 TetR/AcrR family transcriptional regulator [Nocardia cyriacigeorgica]NEW52991.1 TetR/AcrR family transcriptional regulator [Nocardia cyriacigeorgica]NEW55162.1 TetR/AcrR family transcriptional regulator [Nocardia cyriacigeorgica]
MREVKKPEVRKAEIVGAAIGLFAEVGFEKTTVDAVISKLGVAKGCFYHHFRSKDELFEACVIAISEQLEAQYLSIIDDVSVAPGARLVAYLDHSYALAAGPGSDGFLADLHSLSFRELHRRVTDAVTAALRPALTRVLDQGVAAGEFDVVDSEFTAVAVLGALTGLHEFHAGQPGLDLPRHRQQVLDLLERILATRLA